MLMAGRIGLADGFEYGVVPVSDLNHSCMNIQLLAVLARVRYVELLAFCVALLCCLKSPYINKNMDL